MKIKKSFPFEPKVESSLITEAFGIDFGFTREICDIDIPDDFEILYITGESGCGKTTIMRELVKGYENQQIPIHKPLFKWCGDTQEDIMNCLEMLCLVGLSDATMFVATYSELSDSQQARARIMLELISSKELIVIDEFLSTLDRKSAQAIAYCIQKAVRRIKKRAIFVTAHDDLEEYLLPTYTVRGRAFPSRFEVSKCEYSGNKIKNSVTYWYGDKFDYRKLRLGELHYKGKYAGGTKDHLFCDYNGETIAVLVSTYRRFDGGKRISRVVVHPSYRGIGIGTGIVQKYLSDNEGIDAVAAMAQFNPFFEKSGMVRVEDSVNKPPAGFKRRMMDLGFELDKWYSRSYCIEFCQDEKHREAVAEFTKSFAYFIYPGGRKTTVEDCIKIVLESPETAGRMVHSMREKRMAKYVQK